MGQKANPNSFRLGVVKKWKTEFIEKKGKELPVHIFKDLEIKSYLHRFLRRQGFLLHDYKIHQNEETLSIYVSFFIIPPFTLGKKLQKTTHFVLNSDQKKAILKIKHAKPDSKLLRENLVESSNRKNDLGLPQLGKNYLRKCYRRIVLAEHEPFLKAAKSNFQFYPQNRQVADFQKWLKSLSLFVEKQKKIQTIFRCTNKDYGFCLQQSQVLRKNLILLQKYKNNTFFNETINSIILCLYFKNSSSLLAELVSIQLTKTRRHNFFLAFLKKSLSLFVDSTFSKTKGVKIVVKGRLNGAPRARRKILLVGNIPVQKMDLKLDYSQESCQNNNGSYGVKVWIIHDH